MIKFSLPENCRTCQLIIQTASCPGDSQSRTRSLPLSSLCTHQLCRLILEYRRLSAVTCIISCSKLTLKTNILGDFNARVGRDFELWKGVLGRHRIDNCNDNGCLLLEFRSEHELIITNTLFQQKDRFKATWRHPRSKHWHLTGLPPDSAA